MSYDVLGIVFVILVALWLIIYALNKYDLL